MKKMNDVLKFQLIIFNFLIRHGLTSFSVFLLQAYGIIECDIFHKISSFVGCHADRGTTINKHTIDASDYNFMKNPVKFKFSENYTHGNETVEKAPIAVYKTGLFSLVDFFHLYFVYLSDNISFLHICIVTMYTFRET